MFAFEKVEFLSSIDWFLRSMLYGATLLILGL